MIHIVMCVESGDKDRIRGRLEELDYPRFYIMEDWACLVSCNKTARELSAELNIGTNDQKGLVCVVFNYSGFADTEIVAWMKAHDN